MSSRAVSSLTLWSEIISDGVLTDSIFEIGAYRVPSKSQNPTVLGQGGPSSTQR